MSTHIAQAVNLHSWPNKMLPFLMFPTFFFLSFEFLLTIQTVHLQWLLTNLENRT